MKFQIITALWGTAFAQRFANITLSTILSPENLPYVAQNHDVCYYITTQLEESEIIKQSPQGKQLESFADVYYDIFRKDECKGNNCEIHWKLWHRAVKSAMDNDRIIIFIIPDNIYADGTLKRWAQYMENGKKAVFMPGIRITQETFLPELAKKNQANTTNPSLSISMQEMMSIFRRHIHPLSGTLTSRSHRFHFHPEAIMERVGTEDFVVLMTTQHPFVFDPHFLGLDTEFCPKNHLDKIEFDRCSTLSITPLLQDTFWYYVPDSLDERKMFEIGNWALHNVKKIFASHHNLPAAISAEPEVSQSEAWKIAFQRCLKFKENIISTKHYLQLCHRLKALGYQRAVPYLLAAEHLFGLSRCIRSQTPFTVLIPAKSFDMHWKPKHWMHLGKEKNLIKLFLNFIIPGRPHHREGELMRWTPQPEFAQTILGYSGEINQNHMEQRSATILKKRFHIGLASFYLVDYVIPPHEVLDSKPREKTPWQALLAKIHSPLLKIWKHLIMQPVKRVSRKITHRLWQYPTIQKCYLSFCLIQANGASPSLSFISRRVIPLFYKTKKRLSEAPSSAFDTSVLQEIQIARSLQAAQEAIENLYFSDETSSSEIQSIQLLNHLRSPLKAPQNLCEEALKKNPLSAEIWYELGQIYLGRVDIQSDVAWQSVFASGKKQEVECMDSYSIPLVTQPEVKRDAMRRLNECQHDLKQDLLQKAAQCFEKAVSGNVGPAPSNWISAKEYKKEIQAWAFFHLGKIYRRLQDKNRAFHAYFNVLWLNYNFAEAHREIAEILCENSKFQKSLNYWIKAIRHVEKRHPTLLKGSFSLHDVQQAFSKVESKESLEKSLKSLQQ